MAPRGGWALAGAVLAAKVMEDLGILFLPDGMSERGYCSSCGDVNKGSTADLVGHSGSLSCRQLCSAGAGDMPGAKTPVIMAGVLSFRALPELSADSRCGLLYSVPAGWLVKNM